MDVLIREFLPMDAKRIAELEQQCNPLPWTEQAIRTDFLTLVATTQDETVVGYLVSSVVVDEVEILILGVDANYRRLKIGLQLLSELMARSQKQGCQKIFLEVREHNTAAIALYEKAGFRKTGIRRKYYADTGEDALLLER